MKNPEETTPTVTTDEVEQNRTIAVEDDRFPGKLAILAIQTNRDGCTVSTETFRLTRDEALALHMLLGKHLSRASA